MILFKNSDLITYQGHKIDDYETFERLPWYLKEFFSNINGFVIFCNTYHIRGCVNQPKWHSLGEVWFGGTKLSDLFESVEPDDIPIAQDLIGNQFLLRDEKMYLLDAERDKIEEFGMDFTEFISQIGELTIEELEESRRKNTGNFSVEPGQLATFYPVKDTGVIDPKLDFSLKAIDALVQIRNLSKIAKIMKNTSPDDHPYLN